MTNKVNNNKCMTTSSKSIRSKARILQKAYPKAKSYAGTEMVFETTINSNRVQKLAAYLIGALALTQEQYESIKENQPQFNFQRQKNELGQNVSNNRLLFSIHGADEARQLMDKVLKKFHVVASWEDMDKDEYFIVLKNPAPEEGLEKSRKAVFNKLRRIFTNHITFYKDYVWVSAVPESAYDILDRDDLFGPIIQSNVEGLKSNEPSNNKPCVESLQNSNFMLSSTSSLFKSVRTYVSHLFAC